MPIPATTEELIDNICYLDLTPRQIVQPWLAYPSDPWTYLDLCEVMTHEETIRSAGTVSSGRSPGEAEMRLADAEWCEEWDEGWVDASRWSPAP